VETELSGGSVSQTEDPPQGFSYAHYLDTICPYFMHYGMTWDEFWYGSIDRLHAYWQAHQFAVEQRNQELWLQGLYIRAAVASCLDKKNKYPDKPQRITPMTAEEQELENKRKVEQMREQLHEIKRRWDAKHKQPGDERNCQLKT